MELEKVPFEDICVVNAQDLEKSYKSTVIFSKVNLCLRKGEIYGLLGPSGCGKTSLLRCILGRLRADKGTILVFGLPPGTRGSGVPGRHVGYMQQDVCLYESLTIAECWHYYGGILGMSTTALERECQLFLTLLRLPSKNTLNSELSGGQRRRVAFAAALLHEPRLLILDEPTVGLDPIVKSRMWNHLRHLATEKNMCIIVATHYIEEARAAHKVGMMTRGTLAIQDTPERLLDRFNCTTLEEAFLNVCLGAHDASNDLQCSADTISSNVGNNHATHRHQSNESNTSLPSIVLTDDRENVAKRLLYNSFYNYRVRWHVLVATLRKNALQFYRFPGAFIFTIVLPAIVVLIAFVAFGESFPVKINVINEDDGELGNAFISFLQVDQLELKSPASLIEARSDVLNGHAICLLHIPRNFSDAFFQRMWQSSFISEEVLRNGKIFALVDVTSLAVGKYVEMKLADSFMQFQSSVYNISGLHPDLSQPFHMDTELRSHLVLPNAINVKVAILSTGMFFIGALISLLFLSLEKSRGHIERNFVSGVTATEIILGSVILQCGLLVLQSVLVMMTTFLFFPRTTATSSFVIYVSIYLNGLVGSLWGVVTAVCFSQVELILCICGSTFLLSGASSGNFWPYESMPVVFQILVKALPHAYPTRAIALLILRTNSIYSPELVYAFIVLFIWIWIFFILALILLQTNNNK